MSVTGTTVADRLREMMDDRLDAKWDAVTKLTAINAAIDSAWPEIKAVAVDSSITLANTTFEYTPSGTAEVEGGFAIGYVTLTSNPKQHLKGLSQRQSGTTWIIRVRRDIASAYTGQTLHLQYNTRVARIAALGDSVELPIDYLWKMAGYYLCLFALTKSAHFDVKAYERLGELYRREAEMVKAKSRRGDLPHEIATVTEEGRTSTTGRYGEGIISNP